MTDALRLLRLTDDIAVNSRRGEVEMPEPELNSVTLWIGMLKEGDPESAAKLWQRYFEALVKLARKRLRGAARTVADEEDAALSAFDSFVRGAARGRYPRLDDRDDLWRLLVVITDRKALDQAQHERRKKRGGGKVQRMSRPDEDDEQNGDLGRLVGAEPTPEFAAMVADECRELMARLPDDSLREVARLRMEGYSCDEVALQLKCSPRTVARKIEIIRRTWVGEEGQLP
jgi:DNA-directed RNA polymerase specialized sigma24 family protein